MNKNGEQITIFLCLILKSTNKQRSIILNAPRHLIKNNCIVEITVLHSCPAKTVFTDIPQEFEKEIIHSQCAETKTSSVSAFSKATARFQLQHFCRASREPKLDSKDTFPELILFPRTFSISHLILIIHKKMRMSTHFSSSHNLFAALKLLLANITNFT